MPLRSSEQTIRATYQPKTIHPNIPKYTEHFIEQEAATISALGTIPGLGNATMERHQRQWAEEEHRADDALLLSGSSAGGWDDVGFG